MVCAGVRPQRVYQGALPGLEQAQDIALIKALGFDHVRLSVNPQPMFRPRQADELPAEYLDELDAAVKMILDANLAVMIDIHPDSDFKEKLAKEGDFTEQFADFWRGLARHYSNLDPNLVFFEILNEPEARDAYRWYGVESRLAVAIREGAPNHTIIATGARYSDDDDLLSIEPLHDSNVIYTFHFYDPHVFTHQGATWAKRWNVPVICNEFGVFRKEARPEDRAAWISDVRKSLEKHGIGWTMWDTAADLVW